MLTTLKIEYEKEDAIKYEMLKTFLSLCGVFVYEGDHDNNIKKFCICRDKDIDKIFIQLKQELDLNTEESNYFDWLWNLYFQSNQSKEIFLSLFLNNYNSDILSKINVNITRLEILCKEIHNYESDCYSKVYSEMKLLYIIGLYIKEQNADISEILNNISILYKTFDKYANYKSVFSELICAIYMNLVEDYPLAMIFYRNCNLDINYKAHFRVAKYYRLTHNYYKLYTINQKILDCNPYSFKAKYDFALDNEYNGNTAKALNIYQSIIDELILKQDFLNPFEFQILCFSLGQSSKYQEDDIIKSENYDKIFNLLNSLNRNKFISFFVEKDTLIEYYKDRVSEYINSTDQLKKHIEEKENLCEKESQNMFEKKVESLKNSDEKKKNDLQEDALVFNEFEEELMKKSAEQKKQVNILGWIEENKKTITVFYEESDSCLNTYTYDLGTLTESVSSIYIDFEKNNIYFDSNVDYCFFTINFQSGNMIDDIKFLRDRHLQKTSIENFLNAVNLNEVKLDYDFVIKMLRNKNISPVEILKKLSLF